MTILMRFAAEVSLLSSRSVAGQKDVSTHDWGVKRGTATDAVNTKRRKHPSNWQSAANLPLATISFSLKTMSLHCGDQTDMSVLLVGEVTTPDNTTSHRVNPVAKLRAVWSRMLAACVGLHVTASSESIASPRSKWPPPLPVSVGTVSRRPDGGRVTRSTPGPALSGPAEWQAIGQTCCVAYFTGVGGAVSAVISVSASRPTSQSHRWTAGQQLAGWSNSIDMLVLAASRSHVFTSITSPLFQVCVLGHRTFTPDFLAGHFLAITV